MPLAGLPAPGAGAGAAGHPAPRHRLGSQITLINSPAMLAPDMASISIVNGPSVVQGLPFAPQAQQDKQLNLPQTSVLLLPDRPGPEDRGPGEEPFLHLPQPNQQHLLQHNPQPAPTELQMPPPVVTLLQPLPSRLCSTTPRRRRCRRPSQTSDTPDGGAAGAEGGPQSAPAETEPPASNAPAGP
ncbi:hypothetical protein ANANG_G00024210 [Anguilla anguilla]|uniref:Uncharacterized protein n=1 Tax=Anguilla anguilla TaxID=7936 RepID=A0A9D3SAZ5_ANGAN|nr:hypothetical protein ANANG_G00024210 [Anguilla anguilla]